MLQTLYPQKWLPYRYLWPFLWNHFDSFAALRFLKNKSQIAGGRLPNVVIIEAGKDELVPGEHGLVLERRCRELGLRADRMIVPGALHTGVLAREEGRSAVVWAIEGTERGGSVSDGGLG
ncbi:unnamed protein product, partial [Diplocarpon coronariae]